jgi:hypothetical protein
MKPGKSREEVLSLLAQMEALRALREDSLALFWSCPRCHATIDLPCTRPGGTPVVRRDWNHEQRDWVASPGYHAPRLDKMIAGWNSVNTNSLRVELDQYGDPPMKIYERIVNSRLYKQWLIAEDYRKGPP